MALWEERKMESIKFCTSTWKLFGSLGLVYACPFALQARGGFFYLLLLLLSFFAINLFFFERFFECTVR